MKWLLFLLKNMFPSDESVRVGIFLYLILFASLTWIMEHTIK